VRPPGRQPALRASRVDYRPNTTLWHLDADGTLFLENAGRTETVTARRVLLATGAIERPAPIPGWTLPGVMTAGAAQILLKTADLVPEGRVVLAGQGPLLYLVATQLLRAGAPPGAILETAPLDNYLDAARYLGSLWPGRQLLTRGLGLVAAIKRAGVPIRRGVRGISKHSASDFDHTTGRASETRHRASFGIGVVFEESPVEADDGVSPNAWGRAMQDMKMILAIDLGVRLVEGNNSA